MTAIAEGLDAGCAVGSGLCRCSSAIGVPGCNCSVGQAAILAAAGRQRNT